MMSLSVLTSLVSTVALPATFRAAVYSIALNGVSAQESSESAVHGSMKVHGSIQEDCKEAEDSSNNSDNCVVQEADKSTKNVQSNNVFDDYPSRPVANPWNPRNVQDLHREYHNIFKHGNRNAASHLWASFILDRSVYLRENTLEHMFAGFCAVSGSPVNPSDFNRYGLNTRYVPGHPQFGESRFGFFHYCCWPCVCDTQDHIWVDTKTILVKNETYHAEHRIPSMQQAERELVQRMREAISNSDSTGSFASSANSITNSPYYPKQYHFAVIGDPCENEAKLDEPFMQPFHGRQWTTLRRDAAELRCKNGKLEGATYSDHGFPIINLIHDAPNGADPLNPVNPTGAGAVVKTQNHAESPQPGRIRELEVPNVVTAEVTRKKYQHEMEWAPMCQDRAKNGYNSGMGEIFRRVGLITRIEDKAKAFTRQIGDGGKHAEL